MSAFRETDIRGRLPLHAAAVQPQQEILHVVLQGESSVQQAGCKAYIFKQSICNLIKPFSRIIPTLTQSYWCVCVCVAVLTSTDLTLEEQTEDGDTALTLAVEAGLVENVRMLLQHRASPHNTNSRNESPLLIGSTHTQSQHKVDKSLGQSVGHSSISLTAYFECVISI